jgi:putative lipase involved disintegration of autophagic bodies
LIIAFRGFRTIAVIVSDPIPKEFIQQEDEQKKAQEQESSHTDEMKREKKKNKKNKNHNQKSAEQNKTTESIQKTEVIIINILNQKKGISSTNITLSLSLSLPQNIQIKESFVTSDAKLKYHLVGLVALADRPRPDAKSNCFFVMIICVI